jgi:arabinofuranosyltransferase
MVDRARVPGPAGLLLAAAAIVLVVHSLAYNFVTDDAYISFVYARSFAEHGELSFNLGSPVEGYTNFLWTVLLGALMIVGIPPELSSRVLGTACALVTLWLVTRMMARVLAPGRGAAGAPADEPADAASGAAAALGDAGAPGALHAGAWAGVPALLLACSSGFACWSSGGLETQLFTMLVTAAIDAVVEAAAAGAAGAAAAVAPAAVVPAAPTGAAERRRRALRRVGALCAFASMTRPEGPLVAAVLGAAWLVHRALVHLHARRAGAGAGAGRGFPLRDELAAAGLFLALWLPWFLWRWWYYGWPFPNTYYVKAAGEWADARSPTPRLASQMIDNGLYYVWIWLRQTRLLYALPLAALGLAAVRPRTPRGLLAISCGLFALAYVPYTVSVGGDFMGLHRFIMPLFVVAALAVVLGLERLASLVPPRPLAAGPLRTTLRAALAGLAGAIVVAAFAATQLELTRSSLARRASDRGIDTPGFLIVYTEDRAKIGRAMAPCLREDDFSIVGGAGAQPYYARMRAIDVFGLVSERIAHEEPRIRARAGHTKWGSDRLLAEHDPTLVLSCYDIRADDRPPPLPCAGFWLGRGYELVTLHVPGLEERGTYYTFLAKKARNFQCPGRVH